MDDIGLGLADLLVVTFALGVTHAIAGLIVDVFRRQGEHPLDEALRAIAYSAQEELPRIREALELLALSGPEEEDEPATRRR
mgnify:CR=1 FL=1